MLICRNCHTNNEDGAVKCVHCKMEGMLVRDNTIHIHSTPKEVQKSSCPNCGTTTDSGADRCGKCRFPLPANQTAANKKIAEN